MFYSIYWGLSKPLLNLSFTDHWIWKLFLILQFPVLHSFLLSAKGKIVLSKIAPASLSTTAFATIASFQLCLVFMTWDSSSSNVWQPSSLIFIFDVLYVGSWLLLGASMYNADLAVQTGFKGWWAEVRGVKPKYKKFPIDGINKYTRNPIYLSFLLILLTSPTWTIDRLAITLLWGTYCFLGPLLKERRYLRRSKEYSLYQQTTPYFLPSFHQTK